MWQTGPEFLIGQLLLGLRLERFLTQADILTQADALT